MQAPKNLLFTFILKSME